MGGTNYSGNRPELDQSRPVVGHGAAAERAGNRTAVRSSDGCRRSAALEVEKFGQFDESGYEDHGGNCAG